MKFDTPGDAVVEDDGQPTRSWNSFFTKVRNWITADSQYGTTAQRPTIGLQPGNKYFDSTLGFPVYVKSVNPVVWVRYDGTVV